MRSDQAPVGSEGLRAAWLAERDARRRAKLEAVRTVSEAVNASLDLEAVLEGALDAAIAVSGLGFGTIHLLEERTGMLVLAAERHLPRPLRAAAEQLELEGSVMGRVLREARARAITDITAEPGLRSLHHLEASGHRTASVVAAPLVLEDRGAGVIALGTLDGREVGDDDLSLLEAIVGPIAAAVGNARLVERLHVLNDNHRMLLRRLVDAREEERQRIAHDIHDDSVQVMTAVLMRLDMLRRRTTDPEEAAALEHLSAVTRDSVARLRSLLFELAPPTLVHEGLAATLRRYLAQQLEEAGVAWRVEGDLGIEPPFEVRTIAYRIAQEALGNVRKHAGAAEVSVELGRASGGIRVRIRDDGVGFEGVEGPSRPGHLGLTSMRERAEITGGWWRLDSRPGEGTVVEFWLPDGTEGPAPPTTAAVPTSTSSVR